MPQILSKQNILDNPDFFIAAVKDGEIFVYPTDTLYGLGGDACNDLVVEKINAIKGRSNKPFLVIVPSWAWLEENCRVTDEARALMKEKWPGPHSFILPLKNREAVSAALLSGRETIGVRWPEHWLVALIQSSGTPFISTSANLSGQPPAGRSADIKMELLEKVDFVIDEDAGVSGQPSSIIDLSQSRATVIR